MKTNLALTAALAFFALSVGVAQGADKPADPDTGAAIGTPGAENKGNPIPVPDKENRASQDGGNPTETTPGAENKGMPAVKE